MNDTTLDAKLIVIDIVPVMVDYCSTQPDLDAGKAQSAELVAQKLDLKKLIGQTNVERCYETGLSAGADTNLRALVIPALAYFTYGRLLRMFQGTFTDSGFALEVGAEDRGNSKSQANEMFSIAETFMDDVFDFLDAEDPDDEDVKPENKTSRISRFGGKEDRSSN